MDDGEFQERYRKAVDGLPDDQLKQVVRLNPFKKREWVNSPEKIRPFLLEQWAAEDREHQEKLDKLKSKKRWFDFF
jgi:hypothetical protein